MKNYNRLPALVDNMNGDEVTLQLIKEYSINDKKYKYIAPIILLSVYDTDEDEGRHIQFTIEDTDNLIRQLQRKKQEALKIIRKRG